MDRVRLISGAMAAAALAVLVVARTSGQSVTIYKTVDAQGNTSYSDHPISPQSRLVTPDVIRPNPAELAREASERAAVTARQDREAQAKAERDDQGGAEARALRERQQRCRAARDRYAMFKDDGRVFRTDAQGNRIYYSDAEIDAQRVATKRAMDEACQGLER